ncbi:hypothetical protein [Ammoniphilus resinae]|uniref:Uncharacterized protein n=1 Tax=Ammoniphilus resinae TaxID=861532 RepID=A0ABS4GQ66_9BACL|nr:hypothetical protein [Ammoniphilus resinae]MBP1932413.1 hypothetical protein [Ammoniphilus resinae]
MRRKLLLFLALVLLLPFQYASAALADIEVFDIAKGEVVQRISNNAAMQEEIIKSLESISGLAKPLDSKPAQGKMIRLPLEKPVQIKNQWVDLEVYEVFMILLPTKEPFLILYDESRNPYLVNFNYSPKRLMEKITT